MQQHMESLLRVVSDTTARTSPVNRHVDVKLVPLSEKNDIETYLVTCQEKIVPPKNFILGQKFSAIGKFSSYPENFCPPGKILSV